MDGMVIDKWLIWGCACMMYLRKVNKGLIGVRPKAIPKKVLEHIFEHIDIDMFA